MAPTKPLRTQRISFVGFVTLCGEIKAGQIKWEKKTVLKKNVV